MSEAAKPLRVLIVDDEAPARSRMRDVLADCAQEMPLEVAGEAGSGRAALELIGQVPCDLIPDLLQVDDECNLYVAEESGHLAAFAAGAQLRLVN